MLHAIEAVVEEGLSNVNKPSIEFIQGQRVDLFLGCLGEAKASDISVDSARNSKRTELQLEDTIQPMTEVMAVAQVARFANDAVLIVNIMANKTAFRPFIYFKHEDVLISTPKVDPLRRGPNKIDIQGLLLFFVVLRLNRNLFCSGKNKTKFKRSSVL